MNGTPFRVAGVGSANILRGPIFEAVMASVLHEERRELSDRISVTSGGLDVELITTNTEAPSRIIPLLCHAFEEDGVVPPELIQDVAVYYAQFSGGVTPEKIAELSNKDKDDMRRLYAVIRPLRMQHQIGIRDKALRGAGISDQYLPKSMKPFQPHDGYDLILAMERRYVPKTEGRYHNEQVGKRIHVDIFSCNSETRTVGISGRRIVAVPPIRVYDELVGTPLPVEARQAASESLTTIPQQVAYFMDTRHTALDRIVEIMTGAAEARKRPIGNAMN
ncbi:MAG: hypothetical protein HYV78_01925 [Candidatus Wildermuthbacteria bacterium]|nr:hypothetical protein [Candidatus Woesearchaeota archaeon]MBI2574128.1 hypothetical protein [Candidatus Wildermuthbacteria bacterium]